MANLEPVAVTVGKVLTDPNALVAIMALGYSVLITLINYFFFKSNLKEERMYQRDFALYQLLVLPGCKKLIDITVLAHVQLESLLPRCVVSKDENGDSRAQVEKSIEELDCANAELESEVLVVISGFSKELSKELGLIIEHYYDQMTMLYSEFDHKKISTDFAAKQNAAYRKHTEIYIDSVFSKIRKCCPITEVGGEKPPPKMLIGFSI